MDENSKIIQDFETILKEQSLRKPVTLYSSNKILNLRNTDTKQTYTVSDIFSNISKQLDAIQNADCVKKRNAVSKSMNEYKKSTFVPVNMLSRVEQVPEQRINKFETQCVSDSQLINIIQDAEALDLHKGVTQEFDTSFCQTHIEITDNTDMSENKDDKDMDEQHRLDNDTRSSHKHEDKDKISNYREKIRDPPTGSKNFSEEAGCSWYMENKCIDNQDHRDHDEVEGHKQVAVEFPVIDISLKEPDPAKFGINLEINTKEKHDGNGNQHVLIENVETDDIFKEDEMQAENFTQQHFWIEVKENTDLMDIKYDTDIPSSPVFNINCANKKSPPHLVFDLESFENFERIAIPVIESSLDLKAAKTLINSQIIGRELYIQTNSEPMLDENTRNDIPLLMLSNDKSKIDENINIFHPINEDDNLKNKSMKLISIPIDNFVFKDMSLSNSRDNGDKFIPKDEILFSSDEEEDYLQKGMQDLPLTCALETSFYEQSDVLDKTMYVGFLTASNKSIQISSDSFSKAKSIFDSINNIEVDNEASLTELVKSCDSFSSKQSVNNIRTLKTSETNEQYSEDMLGMEAIKSKELNQNTDFVGFKEANGKSIEISENALTKSKVIFEYIEQTTENKNDLGNKCINDSSDTFDESTSTNRRVITLSDIALRKSRNIFKDCISKSNDLEKNQTENDFINKEIEKIRNKITRNITANINTVELIKNANTEKKEASNEQKPEEDIFKEFEDSEMSQFTDEKKDTSKDIVHFIGFKTASNKDIKISDYALAKTAKIFHDIKLFETSVTSKTNDKTDDLNNDVFPNEVTELKIKCDDTEKLCIGFKTASNKAIKISDEALVKTKNIFNDNDSMEFEDPKLANDLLTNYPETKIIRDETNLEDSNLSVKENLNQLFASNPFIGFRTANNKEIKVSDEAMSKTKQIFQDLESEESCSKHIEDKGTIQGFKTASNKKLYMLAKALDRSKRKFEEIDDDDDKSTNDLDEAFPRNKNIKLSGHGLLGSENVFKDIDFSDTFEQNEDEDHNEKVFLGFQTASKKPVQISAQALAKSKYIFKDIDKDISKPEHFKNHDMTAKFQGFKTASNLQIHISKDAMAKSRQLFNDIDEYVSVDAESTEIISKFRGFQSAGKKVNISDEVLAQSRKIFSDIDEEKSTNVDTYHIYPKFQGFQTASNKHINVSADTLAKSRKLFEDIEKEVSTTDNPSIIPRFQTASYKEIKISEEALAKSKTIFEGIREEMKDDVNVIPKFQGFKTASNKKIQISENALAKSRQLINDIDKIVSTNIKSTEVIPKFEGFRTASNKNVKISEEALARSRKIFDDLDVDVSMNLEIIDNVPKFQGFQTASNNKVIISETALAKSKTIFDSIDLAETSTVQKNILKGFQTASNREVKISDEALAKSKKLFQDIYSFKDDNKLPKENIAKSFIGFQTASNKEVKISEQALARSRQMFQDLDFVSTNFEQNQPQTIKNDTITSQNAHAVDNNYEIEKAKVAVFGFKSANNKDIKISEEALLKSKRLLAYLDGNDKNTLIKEDNYQPEIKTCAEIVPNDDINLKNIIDTQILNVFEESLHTEDFYKETTPIKSKRSGSPILSCPKAKKRKKFEIPYSQVPKTDKKDDIVKDTGQNCEKSDNLFKFDQNYKKIKKFTLKDLKHLEAESTNAKTEVDPYILNFNFENLSNLEFFDNRNDITDTKWTTDDLKKYFLNSVNKKFVPDGWLDIHLKLILWKLISYEIVFPNSLGIACTAKNVIEQLKFRYDKELYNAERPVLRKILEKDDMASKTMILCVVAIHENGVPVSRVSSTTNVELLLTDGWYCVKACIDQMLSKLVADGKIRVGTKIITNGAELMNCDQGVAPWEDISSVRLKLHGNSTFPAHWAARLGRHGAAAVLSRLHAIEAGGGRAGRLRVFVARVYPALYVEKFEDGSTVTRSERLENLHQMKYESERQAMLEKIYEEVQKEFSDEDSQDSDIESSSKRCLDTGSQIAKVMKTSKDPGEFRSHLTNTQRTLLQEYSSKQREKLLQKIQRRVVEKMENMGLNINRNVIVLLKIRVVGLEELNGEVKVTKAMMSIWKPNDAVLEIIKEGTWIEVLNVVPTAVRYSEIQISAGRQSVFLQSNYKESEKLKPYIKSLKRTCYSIKDLAKNPSMTTDYNEIDTVGLIFLFDPLTKNIDTTKHQFQNVYLADEDKNIICLNFWGGLKKFGFENVLEVGEIIACTNLQKRAGNTRKNIAQYRVTEFSYFTKTPKNENARKVVEDLSKKLHSVDRSKFCDDCINLRNNYSITKLQNLDDVSPYRFKNIDINSSKNRIFVDSPLTTKKMDENLNLTGLDFESTFKQPDTQELSPRTLLRKRQVKEKIAKLKMYGEPPPLSPMQILNKSKNAGHAFKSPLISQMELSVASENKILHKDPKLEESDIQCSPVIMNRTYVKKGGNPVRLNFSRNVSVDENKSESIDHFAGDFDGSPPLSLD